MTLRKVPGALALGLLASLAAHTAVYGDEHAMGGTYHLMLMQAALAGAVSLLIFGAALAWSSSARLTDGSVVAARLRERLPGLPWILAAAGLWYTGAEALEPHHAGPSPLLLVLVLSAAAWVVLRIARAVVALLAGVVIAVTQTQFSPRSPSWARRPRRRPISRRLTRTRRRFARPPPILTPRCA